MEILLEIEVHLKKFLEGKQKSIVIAGKIIIRTLKKEGLLHLLCRPWERIWLKRTLKQSLKAKIIENKESFQSLMRCLIVLPSVP